MDRPLTYGFFTSKTSFFVSKFHASRLVLLLWICAILLAICSNVISISGAMEGLIGFGDAEWILISPTKHRSSLGLLAMHKPPVRSSLKSATTLRKKLSFAMFE